MRYRIIAVKALSLCKLLIDHHMEIHYALYIELVNWHAAMLQQHYYVTDSRFKEFNDTESMGTMSLEVVYHCYCRRSVALRIRACFVWLSAWSLPLA